VLPQAVARQSRSRRGSGHSPQQHGHSWRPGTTAAADPCRRHRPPRKERPALPLHTRPSGTIWFLAGDFRTIEDEDSLDPVGGRCAHSPATVRWILMQDDRLFSGRTDGSPPADEDLAAAHLPAFDMGQMRPLAEGRRRHPERAILRR
jgi:hypothetical protein